MTETLRVGTRGSPLARAQADEVVERLRQSRRDLRPEIVVIKTEGDDGYKSDLGSELAGKRAFTKRIEDALLESRIDLAVHSAKDLPTEPVDGVEIAAVPSRADPRDVLVAVESRPIAQLNPGTRIGTSSLRRRAQLLARWPSLEIVELRGNVDTRLQKVREGKVDAVVIAAAGIDRLHVAAPYVERIDPEVLTPAPGQGALAIQTRSEDARTRRLVAMTDDPPARRAVEAERAVSRAIGGGCNVPFGALATIANGEMSLQAIVASPDGHRLIRASVRDTAADSLHAAEECARLLREGGAREILRGGT